MTPLPQRFMPKIVFFNDDASCAFMIRFKVGNFDAYLIFSICSFAKKLTAPQICGWKIVIAIYIGVG